MRRNPDIVLEKGLGVQEEGAISQHRCISHVEGFIVATADSATERENESCMDDAVYQQTDSEIAAGEKKFRVSVTENVFKEGNTAVMENVGPETPAPSYGEDKNEDMDYDNAISQIEGQAAALGIPHNNDDIVDESHLERIKSYRRPRTLDELLAMCEHGEEWEDEDDDEDWEPMHMEWFCTNCTLPNLNRTLHCRYCEEHQRSGILNAGFLAPADLPFDEVDKSKTEKETSSGGPLPDSQVHPSPRSLLPVALSTSPRRSTAVGYDERMLLHHEGPIKLHPHPERPDRLRSIVGGLSAAGLFQQCHVISAREASRVELEMVHTKEHVDAVESTLDGDFSRYFTSDTYANKNSALAARLAAGICADLATFIMKGEAQNGIALVRPPGHHAEQSNIMGFCLHNNAAIAAKAALASGARKVLILDWDVHHGNGTQEIFNCDPSVLYISLHRHDKGAFYPGTGAASEVGINKGEGFSVNIPWICGGIGDDDYIYAFRQIVLPIASQFMADIIIVSAGFDAAKGDPLGGCEVTPCGYANMMHMLSSLAQGRVLVILEGGYNLRSISSSVAAVVKVLLGESPELILDSLPTEAGLATVLEVTNIQNRYWKIGAANAGQKEGVEDPLHLQKSCGSNDLLTEMNA